MKILTKVNMQGINIRTYKRNNKGRFTKKQSWLDFTGELLTYLGLSFIITTIIILY